MKSAYIEEFTEHIITQDRYIKFTREEEEDGTLPFLDTVMKSAYIEEFTEHIITQDRYIKFTREEEEDGTLPFLDTVIKRLGDGSIKIEIYRKPTHTDQYLHFRSHHPLEHKLSVVKTLLHRSEIVIDPVDRSEEVEHVKTALRNCGYSDWTFFRASNKREKTTTQEKDLVSEKRGPTVTLSYIEGWCGWLKAWLVCQQPSNLIERCNKPWCHLRINLIN